MVLKVEYIAVDCPILDRCCLCIAMLGNTLTRMSVNLHPVEPTNGSVGGSDGSNSPQLSPRGSLCGEKQMSLTPLADMSTARCGVGTTVLNGQLVVLGKSSTKILSPMTIYHLKTLIYYNISFKYLELKFYGLIFLFVSFPEIWRSIWYF